MEPARIELLSRAGCTLCTRLAGRLTELAGELDFGLVVTDVDDEAAAGRPALRAEYGDRLPVVLLDDVEHSDCAPTWPPAADPTSPADQGIRTQTRIIWWAAPSTSTVDRSFLYGCSPATARERAG
jgi:hypothetical protein